MSRLASRTKIEKPGRTSVPAVSSVTPEIVKLPDKKWNILQESDEASEFIAEMIDNLLSTVDSCIYERYLERQLIPFTVSNAKDDILEIVEWLYLARDEGPKTDRITWSQDQEPALSVIDSWSQGCVPKVSTNQLQASIKELQALTNYTDKKLSSKISVSVNGMDVCSGNGITEKVDITEDGDGTSSHFNFKAHDYHDEHMRVGNEDMEEVSITDMGRQQQQHDFMMIPDGGDLIDSFDQHNAHLTAEHGIDDHCEPSLVANPDLTCFGLEGEQSGLSNINMSGNKLKEKLDLTCLDQGEVQNGEDNSRGFTNNKVSGNKLKEGPDPTCLDEKEDKQSEQKNANVSENLLKENFGWYVDVQFKASSSSKIPSHKLLSNRIETFYTIMDSNAVANGNAIVKNKNTNSAKARQDRRILMTRDIKESVDEQKSAPKSSAVFESMELVAGVTLKELNRIKKGPKLQNDSRKSGAIKGYDRKLEPIRSRHDVDVSDMIDEAVPIIKPLQSFTPVPPIGSRSPAA